MRKRLAIHITTGLSLALAGSACSTQPSAPAQPPPSASDQQEPWCKDRKAEFTASATARLGPSGVSVACDGNLPTVTSWEIDAGERKDATHRLTYEQFESLWQQLVSVEFRNLPPSCNNLAADDGDPAYQITIVDAKGSVQITCVGKVMPQPYDLLVKTLSRTAAAFDDDGPMALPGTQPSENGIELAKVEQCRLCHAETDNGDADPFFSWQAGMMAQAARDPVFRAALAIANQDVPGSGEFCIRCHAPRGWLEGRSKVTDGSALTPEDMHGVSCDVCHRLVDPLTEEATRYAARIPPGYGNGMIVADPGNVTRGPYEDRGGAKPHIMVQTRYQGTSELCANCHNVSNPLLATDRRKQPPETYGHIERTYSEWALSDMAQGAGARTCQSCHYPAVDGGGQASRYGSQRRDHFVQHGPVGGSTWVQKATALLWPDSGLTARHIDVAQRRARALLRSAATLELRIGGARPVLRITNNTGHKLPTGYPEGRRMWVNVRYLDRRGKLLSEIGRYGKTAATLAGNQVSVPTLLDPDTTRVYENVPGVSEEQAKRHGLTPGKSFHFVLNDVILKDNRIPPRGFNNDAFAEHLAKPVGATYADGQHWDELELDPPAGTKRVEIKLMYQSVSWEYIKFLYEANRTDDWGKKLYDAWTKTGQCPPEVIAEFTSAL